MNSISLFCARAGAPAVVTIRVAEMAWRYPSPLPRKLENLR